jgi:hypothetical protein
MASSSLQQIVGGHKEVLSKVPEDQCEAGKSGNVDIRLARPNNLTTLQKGSSRCLTVAC